VTHGYVGYDLHEDYIACPKCGENTNDTKVEVDEILILNPDFDPDKDIPF
jgi:hypothetical protein